MLEPIWIFLLRVVTAGGVTSVGAAECRNPPVLPLMC
jgi:hypothetical protein